MWIVFAAKVAKLWSMWVAILVSGRDGLRASFWSSTTLGYCTGTIIVK